MGELSRSGRPGLAMISDILPGLELDPVMYEECKGLHYRSFVYYVSIGFCFDPFEYPPAITKGSYPHGEDAGNPSLLRKRTKDGREFGQVFHGKALRVKA